MATVIDATDCVLGRMANQVAKRLLGGEEIFIVNAEKAIVSGATREAIKARYLFKREIGTYRKGPFMSRMPHALVKRTVRGMIPYHTNRGRMAVKRLKTFIGVPKELTALPAEVIAGAKRNPGVHMTVAEISEFLGAPGRKS